MKCGTRIARTTPLLTWFSAVVALSLTACGSSGGDSQAGAGGLGSGGQSGGVEVGKFLDSATPCTEPHTVCMNMVVPSTLDAEPVSLLFDIYDSPGTPNHLPNAYAGYFNAPMLTAGQQLYLQLSDGALVGDYWMFTVMYMPGGGVGSPLVGVDYVQTNVPAPLHLDGSPLNIADPVALQR